MARRKNTKKLNHEETLEKKKAVLAALAKNSEDSLFLKESAGALSGKLQDYYTLSRGKMAIG